jgi:hypothetical protein
VTPLVPRECRRTAHRVPRKFDPFSCKCYILRRQSNRWTAKLLRLAVRFTKLSATRKTESNSRLRKEAGKAQSVLQLAMSRMAQGPEFVSQQDQDVLSTSSKPAFGPTNEVRSRRCYNRTRSISHMTVLAALYYSCAVRHCCSEDPTGSSSPLNTSQSTEAITLFSGNVALTLGGTVNSSTENCLRHIHQDRMEGTDTPVEYCTYV